MERNPSLPTSDCIASVGRHNQLNQLNESTAVITEGLSTSEIRVLIQSMLQKCGWIYSVPSYNESLDHRCREALSELDSRLDDGHDVQKYIPQGVHMAWGMYSYIEDEKRLVYIALYTALLTCMEDKTVKDITWIHRFGECLLNGGDNTMYDPVLTALVRLLGNTALYFGPFATNTICAATQSFMSGLMMEHETREMADMRPTEDYAEYVRRLTGVAPPYVMFGFPDYIPVKAYVQTLPGMTTIFNFVNDILSFYKEQRAGEIDNYISTICAARGVSKKRALEELIEEISRIHHRNLNTLAADVHALGFYKKMFQGYVAFHAGSERYKLHDLELA